MDQFFSRIVNTVKNIGGWIGKEATNVANTGRNDFLTLPNTFARGVQNVERGAGDFAQNISREAADIGGRLDRAPVIGGIRSQGIAQEQQIKTIQAKRYAAEQRGKTYNLTPEEEQAMGNYYSQMIPFGGMKGVAEDALKGALPEAEKFAEPLIHRAEAAGQGEFKDLAGEVKPAIEEGVQQIQKGAGGVLRRMFLGWRNSRIGETNQQANFLEQLLPKKIDREALFINRELRSDPVKANQVLDLLHQGNKELQPYKDVIMRALNGHSMYDAANKVLDEYFGSRLDDGKVLGYIKGDGLKDYITHIVQQGEKSDPFRINVGRAAAATKFTFGQGRKFTDVIDLITNGFKPASLDASDVMRIYGEREAVVHATHQFINQMTQDATGQWVSASELPRDWVALNHWHPAFAKGNQVFAVPKVLGDMMKPILDPNHLKQISWISKFRMIQSYSKYVELSFSLFHAKQLSIVAMNSMNPIDIAKAIGTDMDGAWFRNTELEMLKTGEGTSPILGEEYNAYRRTLDPGGKNLLTDNPLTKVFSYIAGKTSGITFDQIQRRYKVVDYSSKIGKWMASHPKATEEELNAARVKVARTVNGLYGGLNWEAMGVTKDAQTVLRALLLAPDWTFSNFILPFGALKGNVPKGLAVRFLGQSLVAGIVLTQMSNLMWHGKFSNDPFNVTLGYRKNGTRVKGNLFFAGDVRDVLNTLGKVKDYGLPEGLALELASKSAPFVKTLSELANNKDYYGNTIVPQGAGAIQGTTDWLKYVATSGGLPLPFTISNPLNISRSTGGENTPLETIVGATGLGSLSTEKTPKAQEQQRLYNQYVQEGDSDFIARMKAMNATKSRGGSTRSRSTGKYSSRSSGYRGY